jgi:antirestriction protein ArdC
MQETQQATEGIAPDSSAIPKRDFRQEVTNQIIEMLEKGTAPWQTPWKAGTLRLPFNPTTDRPYRGGNALHLMAVGERHGFNDPRWLTYRQARDNGWQVRKGEKGTQIEYWQFDSGMRARAD